MGIDIYMKWEGQSSEDTRKQCTGFSLTSGDVGYLREAYHGDPYATQYLVSECFGDETNEVAIPASVLRKRLPRTLRLAKTRMIKLYKETDMQEIKEVQQAFIDFVELAEKMEEQTGKPVTILASY